jgi:hypothetical protein
MRCLFGVRCESDEGYAFVYLDDGCVEGGWFADVEVEDSGTGLGAYAEEVAESLTDRRRRYEVESGKGEVVLT